jgi:hypothetical protein
MNCKVARLLIRLYPREWRERYGAEFQELLESEPGGMRASANVVWSAVREHIFPTRGNQMANLPMTVGSLMKRPDAFLPVAMSTTAFVMTLVAVLRYGAVSDPSSDEGAIAHLWQLLMAGQLPIILFFAIKWLPRAPRQALYVLAQQMGAAGVSSALVFFLGL